MEKPIPRNANAKEVRGYDEYDGLGREKQISYELMKLSLS